jgi:protein ImuB
LFSDSVARHDPRHLAGLVDRLSSRLGRKAVVRPRLLPDAQPELAYRYDPLIGGSPGASLRRNRSREMTAADLPPRPLRLLCRPVPLTAVWGIPDGPPLRFHWGGQEHRIAQSWGPERIETGWWRGRPVGRDYYRIQTTTGRRYWLFRRLRDGQWFLQGLFE